MDAFTKKIENGKVTVTHTSGHQDIYDQGHYNQFVAKIESEIAELKVGLLRVKIERQEIINSQRG